MDTRLVAYGLSDSAADSGSSAVESGEDSVDAGVAELDLHFEGHRLGELAARAVFGTDPVRALLAKESRKQRG
jgi:hypothetical protein